MGSLPSTFDRGGWNFPMLAGGTVGAARRISCQLKLVLERRAANSNFAKIQASGLGRCPLGTSPEVECPRGSVHYGRADDWNRRGRDRVVFGKCESRVDCQCDRQISPGQLLLWRSALAPKFHPAPSTPAGAVTDNTTHLGIVQHATAKRAWGPLGPILKS